MNGMLLKPLHKWTFFWICSVTGLFMCLAAIPSQAQTATWSSPTGTGNWFTGTNWVNGSYPTGTIDAVINNTGYPTISSAGAQAGDVYVGYFGTGGLTVTNGGTLTSSSLYLGYQVGATGTLTISGPTSTVTTSTLSVGDWVKGNLNVSNGGKMVSSTAIIGNTFYYAVTSGSGTVISSASGSATITGAGSSFTSTTLTVGNAATGSLLISNGATATTGQLLIGQSLVMSTVSGIFANGTVTVSGLGSSLNVTGAATNSIVIGSVATGSGALVVSDGAAVNAAASGIIIGKDASSTGSLTITGTYSAATHSQLVTTGDLTVASGGRGTLNVSSGGILSNAATTIASASGSTGSATINNGTWTMSGALTTGDSGTGTLTANNGSTIVGTTAVLGKSTGGNGTLSLDGTGTAATFSGALTAGNAGTGTLTVSGAAKLQSDKGTLGSAAGSTGSATVTGTGSQWTMTNTLSVGESGTGNLTISGGGRVASANEVVGNQAGSQGTVIVTGAGSTLTTSGDLIVGNAGTGTVTVSSGAQLAANNLTLGKASTATGSINLSGTTLTLANLIVGNSGSGTIVMNAGTAVNSTTASIAVNAGSQGSVTVNASTWTLSNPLIVGIAGNGTVTVGNGGVINAGAATVTLGSAVGSSGTLNIGAAAGNAAAGTGTISATTITTGLGSGTLQLNHTATSGSPFYLTSTGASGGTAINVSGNTNLTQTAGYTVLKAGGTYDYAGITTVSGGTLSVAGNITGTSKVIVNGGTLLTSGTITTAVTTLSNGAINTSGTLNSTSLNVTGGTLTSSGTLTTNTLNVTGGTLQASGTLAAAASTTINGGTVLLDTNLTTPVVTLSSGSLIVSDTRSVIATNVNVTNGTIATAGYNNATLAPATITFSNNVSLSSGSTTGVHVINTTPGQADLMHVTGTAALNGNLATNFNNSSGYIPKANDSFVVMEAGSYTGNFNSFSSSFNNYFVFTTGSYSGNDYTVTVSMVQKSFATAATNPNQMGIAQALNRDIRPGSPMQPAMDYINSLPESSWGHALDLLSPEQLTAAPSAGIANANSLYSILGGRFNEVHAGQRFSDSGLVMWDPSREFSRNSLLASNGPLPQGYQPAEPTFFNNPNLGFFVSGQGTFGDVNGDNQAEGYNFNSGGIILGCDYRVAEHTVVGIYGGYQGTDTNLSDNGDAKTDSGKFGLYVSQWWDQGAWINASIGGGYNSYTNKRAALGDFAKSSPTGTEFNFQAQQGYDFHMGRWTFGPTLEVDYTNLSIDGFTETGSLAPLNVQSQTAESLPATIGGRVSTSIDVNHNQWKVSPYANVGLRHEFLDTKQATTASFANGSGATFTVNGPEVDANSIVAGFGIALQLSPRWSGQLGYFAQANDDYLVQSITGSVVFRF